MLDSLDQPGDDSPELLYASLPLHAEPDEYDGLDEAPLYSHSFLIPDDKYDVPPAPPADHIEFVPSPAGIRAREQARRGREHVCVFAGVSFGIGIMLAGHALTYISAGQWSESGIAFVGAAISVILGCLTWGVGEKKVPR